MCVVLLLAGLIAVGHGQAAAAAVELNQSAFANFSVSTTQSGSATVAMEPNTLYRVSSTTVNLFRAGASSLTIDGRGSTIECPTVSCFTWQLQHAIAFHNVTFKLSSNNDIAVVQLPSAVARTRAEVTFSSVVFETAVIFRMPVSSITSLGAIRVVATFSQCSGSLGKLSTTPLTTRADETVELSVVDSTLRLDAELLNLAASTLGAPSSVALTRSVLTGRFYVQARSVDAAVNVTVTDCTFSALLLNVDRVATLAVDGLVVQPQALCSSTRIFASAVADISVTRLNATGLDLCNSLLVASASAQLSVASSIFSRVRNNFAVDVRNASRVAIADTVFEYCTMNRSLIGLIHVDNDNAPFNASGSLTRTRFEGNAIKALLDSNGLEWSISSCEFTSNRSPDRDTNAPVIAWLQSDRVDVAHVVRNSVFTNNAADAALVRTGVKAAAAVAQPSLAIDSCQFFGNKVGSLALADDVHTAVTLSNITASGNNVTRALFVVNNAEKLSASAPCFCNNTVAAFELQCISVPASETVDRAIRTNCNNLAQPEANSACGATCVQTPPPTTPPTTQPATTTAQTAGGSTTSLAPASLSSFSISLIDGATTTRGAAPPASSISTAAAASIDAVLIGAILLGSLLQL